MTIYRRLLSTTILTAAAALTLSASAQLTVATATQGISLTQLASATDLGPASPSQPMTVRLGLQLQNKAALQSYVQSVNTKGNGLYGQRLTPAQFTAKYSPSTAQVQSVVSFLSSAGFSNIKVEPNNLIVSADGTAAIASAAFHTPIETYSQFGKKVYGNKLAAQVPASLGSLVSAVLGLNTIGQMHSQIALPTQVPQYLVSYTPNQFISVYGGTGAPTGQNTTIAIMAEGDVSGVVTDLRTAEGLFGLTQVPVTIRQVGLPSTDVSGADEWDLDTQYSTGMAGGVAQLYIYATTSLSDSDLALEISSFVTDDFAQAGSASLGECETFPYIDGSMIVDDNSFLEAAAQGQTFFASTGDTGSFCPAGPAAANGVPAGAPLVNYPASSPYVVAVGGTTLLTNSDGSYDKETAWYSGGGGISQFEGPGYWQKAASTIVSESSSRAIPDIAFDADPESGANVVVNGTPEGVGGTSLSSPACLGIWARVLSVNPNVGFGAIAMYSIYDGTGLLGAYPVGGYNDVTVGVNGLYAATPGYDLTTGLGTPSISALVNAFTPLTAPTHGTGVPTN